MLHPQMNLQSAQVSWWFLAVLVRVDMVCALGDGNRCQGGRSDWIELAFGLGAV